MIDKKNRKMNRKRSVTCKANCEIVDIDPSIPTIKFKWSKYLNKSKYIRLIFFSNNIVFRQDAL